MEVVAQVRSLMEDASEEVVVVEVLMEDASAVASSMSMLFTLAESLVMLAVLVGSFVGCAICVIPSSNPEQGLWLMPPVHELQLKRTLETYNCKILLN